MRRVLTVVAGVLAGAGVGLSVAADAPANEASISNAKKELDLLRASRGLPTDTRSAMPRLELPSAPALSLGGDAPAPAVSPKDAKPSTKRSTNWLVDAMQKETDATATGKGTRAGARESDVRDRLLDLPNRLATEAAGRGANGEIEAASDSDLLQMQLELERRQAARRDAEAAETARKTDLPVFNPLNSYMAEWMSAGDYALLQAGAGANAVGGSNSPDAASTANSNSGLISALSGTSLPGGPAAASAALGGDSISAAFGGMDRDFLAAPSRASAAANPFLQPLDPAAPSPVSAANLSATSAPAAFPLLPGTSDGPVQRPAFAPEPPPSAPAKLPDFVRPQTDEKYFKQLKRF